MQRRLFGALVLAEACLLLGVACGTGRAKHPADSAVNLVNDGDTADANVATDVQSSDSADIEINSQDAQNSADALGGQFCGSLGALACAGPAQQVSLICRGGTWQVLATCDVQQRCDQTTGLCTDVVPGCAGRNPGYSACTSHDTVTTCGPDLVTVTSTTCTGMCVAGACQPPRCGDGKIEGSEACDDGNTIPGDGCEPDCTATMVMKLAAGRAHTCALLSQGNVRCWGANDKGQLGLGDSVDRGANKPYQNGLVGLGAAALAIAAGADHTCALLADHSIRCWGANDHGQLGLGHTNSIGDDETPSASVATVTLGMDAKTVAAGGNCTCAILADDTLRCWGQNDSGQLGLGHTHDIGDDEFPTQALAQVSLGGAAKLVATGGNHTCAILADGYTLRCWGRNGLGQLGLGILENVGDDELPTDVEAVMFPTDSSTTTAMASIVAGASRTCASRIDGIARCWGDNSDGGLGVGYVGAMPLNTALDWGLASWNSPMLEFSAGAFHICTVLANNQFRCWGLNAKAQLGLADRWTLGDYQDVLEVLPIDLGKGSDGFASYARTSAAGAAHTCVVLGDGNVRCWGANESGQLGLGFKSLPPTDYVGGTSSTIPGKLDLVLVLHP
jgi:cysteine-rich repeat protein